LKITLDSIISGFKSVTKLIANFDSIESELNDKVLYRDNPEGEPNQMNNDLDMNGNKISNLPNGVFATDAATYAQVLSVSSGSGAGVGTTKTAAVGVLNQKIYTTPTYVQGGNNLSVYVDGLLSQDYSEASTTTVNFGTAPAENSSIVFIVNERAVDATFNVASSVTADLESNPTNVQDAINSIQSDLSAAESSLTTTTNTGNATKSRVDGHDDILEILSPMNVVEYTGNPVAGSRYRLGKQGSQAITLPAGVDGDRISFNYPRPRNGSVVGKNNTVTFTTTGGDLIFTSSYNGVGDASSTTVLQLDPAHTRPAKYDNPEHIIGQILLLSDLTQAPITAYTYIGNTVTLGSPLVMSGNTSYRIGRDEWEVEGNSNSGDFDLVFRAGGWIPSFSASNCAGLLGPETMRKVGYANYTGATETLQEYLVEQDEFLEARLDGSLSDYNLFNSTLTGSVPTGSSRIPVNLYWKGTSLLTLTPDETAMDADRFGGWVGDREETYVANLSVNSDIVVSISGLTSTTQLTLMNGVARTITDSTIVFTTPSTMGYSGSSFTQFNVGDVIEVTGSADNDGAYTVASVGASTIVFAEATIVNESAGASITLDAGVYRGVDDVTIPSGCDAKIRRLDATEVLVTTSHSRVTK